MTDKEFINLIKAKYYEYYVPDSLGITKSVAEEVNEIVQLFRKEIEDDTLCREESNSMKILIKTDHETLTIICNAMLDGNVLRNIGADIAKLNYQESVLMEVRDVLIKRWSNGTKESRIYFYKHSLEMLLLVLVNILKSSSNNGSYERNKIELLKNDLHKKLL